MSLSRLILRGLALNALLPQPGDLLPVTMAQGRVFDSRLDPLQFRDEPSDLPALIVYTDGDDAALLNKSANTGPFLRMADLRVEMIIGSYDAETEGVYYKQTDAALEARLDLFEQQVRWALMGYSARPATSALRGYVIAFEHVASIPQRDEESNNRFAARVLNIKCRIKDDCKPAWGVVGEMPAPPSSLTCDDFKCLPPWLCELFVSLQNNPSMQQVIGALGGQSTPANLVTMFEHLMMHVSVVEASDPISLAEAKKIPPERHIEWEALASPNKEPL